MLKGSPGERRAAVMFDACKCVHAVWDHPQRTSALRGGEENKNMTIVCSDKLRDWHSDKREKGVNIFANVINGPIDGSKRFPFF